MGSLFRAVASPSLMVVARDCFPSGRKWGRMLFEIVSNYRLAGMASLCRDGKSICVASMCLNCVRASLRGNGRASMNSRICFVGCSIEMSSEGGAVYCVRQEMRRSSMEVTSLLAVAFIGVPPGSGLCGPRERNLRELMQRDRAEDIYPV